jgi:fructoselysine-6-P-deglycase FrlB-like protein
VLDGIETNSINALERELEAARAEGHTIFVVGNGGSAATATTMANDISQTPYLFYSSHAPDVIQHRPKSCQISMNIADDCVAHIKTA